MPTVKKLQFANGTNITPPADLTLETAVDSLPTFADDAAYDVEYVVKEGSIYLNTTLKSPRMYLGGAWRTGIMQNNVTDATKQVVLDTDGALTGVTHTLDFNGTLSRTYTFPDTSATVVLTLGAQELQSKTIKNGFLDGTKIRNGALDVEAAGALKIGESIGPHTLILGGTNSAVVVPGSLFVEGITTSVNTVNLDVKDKNITVNNGGNDVVSEGAGLTVDRTGTKGSLIYKDSAPNKFAAGALGSEKNIAAVDDITASNLSGTIPASKGGTGVANNDAATLTRSGNHALTLTTTGVTSLTLPTTGTVVTENGSAVLLNKTTVSSTNATTGALRVPVGTTGEQPSPATQGMIRYNTTDATFEGYDGTEWGAIGGGGGGGTLDVINQVGHSLSVGDVVYLNGSTYTKAKADAANTAEVVGVVSKVNTADQFELTLSGEVSGLTGLVAGEVYFLSPTTAGALTVTEPTVVGQVSLPVGVASSTTSLYVAPKRGAVVGSSNARTQIALSNNATTTVQDISAYDAGELTGWVSITATTPLRFYVAAQFSKNGAANNYNVSYQVSGDTVPTGFSVTATAAGLLQVTLPSVTGFASASINYALNAPAVGTSFPLSVQSSSIVWSEPVAFRNKIINGNFDIWQRGTTQSVTGYGSADRWESFVAGSTTVQSRQSFTLGQTDVPNEPRYFVRRVVTSVAGASNASFLQQYIEGVRTFAGKTITVSFWAKADSNKKIAIDFRQWFGTGGSTAVSAIGAQKFDITSSWKKITATISIPSIAGKTIGDENSSLAFRIWMDAGSSFNANTDSMGQQSGTFDIAQVQLEEGTVATPFEDRPIGTELQMCQRYYFRFVGGTNSFFGVGQVSNATQVVGYLTFPTTMRTIPSGLETTATASNYRCTNSTTGTVNCTSLPAYNAANLTGATVLYTASSLGGTSGFASLIGTDGTGYLGFSAEL